MTPLSFVVACSALSTAAVSLACSITAPMQGTIWKTGELVTVSWSGAPPDAMTSISLAQGSKSSQVKVIAKLANQVSAAEGKYVMRLPTNITHSNDYYVILGEDAASQCISAPFFIEQGSGSNNVKEPASPAPKSTSATTPLVGEPNPSMVVSSAMAAQTSNGGGMGHHRGRTSQENKNNKAAKEGNSAKSSAAAVAAPEDALWLLGHLLGTTGIFIFASTAVSFVF